MAASLLEQINDVADELARQACDGDGAAESIVRCNLMVKLWSLHVAQETKNADLKKLHGASAQLHEWERRRGEILKVLKIDVFRECLRRMDDMQKQAARLNRIRQQESENTVPWTLPS